MTTPKGLPIYQQIVEDFKSKILHNEWRPNDPIPSQIELAKIYNTSEMTLRKALDILVEEGLIYRIKKKGSFIKESKLTRRISDSKIKKIYFVHPNLNMRLLTQGFNQSILSGIQNSCYEHQIEFSMLNVSNGIDLIDEQDCAFILFADLVHSQSNLYSEMENWGLKKALMVTVQFYFPHLDIPYIVGDNITGGYLATFHLLSLGHKRIGIILTGDSPLEINPEFSLRLQGYRLALSNYQIPFAPELIFIMKNYEEDESTGYEGFKHLMSLPNPPTAIFAASDYKAVGAITAAKDLGIRIPEDVSIIGYDGQQFGQFTIPTLTTIDQDPVNMGRKSVELLMSNANGRNIDPYVIPKIITRNSTAINSKLLIE